MFKTLRKNLAEDFSSPHWVFVKLIRQEFIHVLLIPFRLVFFPLTYFTSLFKSQRKALGEQFVSIFCLKFGEDDLETIEGEGYGSLDSIKVGTNFISFILWVIVLAISVNMGLGLLMSLSLVCGITHLIKFFFWMKNP